MILFLITTTLFCTVLTVIGVGPSNLRKEGLRGFLFSLLMVFGVCIIYYGIGRTAGRYDTFQMVRYLSREADHLDNTMATFAGATKRKHIPYPYEEIGDGEKYIKE